MTNAELVPGLLIGTVKEVDPALARVKVTIPEREHETDWAPIASAMSGNGRGAYFMPEVGDEVVVGFDRGRFDHPLVLGCLWNGVDAPPAPKDHSPAPDGQVRITKSVNGHEISLYDPQVSNGDKGFIRIQDGHGNMIELANGIITLKGVAAIRIDAPQIVLNGRPLSPIGSPL
jgi:uncharacterized protein involved in type VI secretion and phage assembly